MITHSEIKQDLKNIQKLINSTDVDILINKNTSILNKFSAELLMMCKELLDVMDNPKISSAKKMKLSKRYKILNSGLHAGIELKNNLINIVSEYKVVKLKKAESECELIDCRIELKKLQEIQKF